MAIKAEILQQILSDADTAQTVPGMENVYTPDEYNKVMAKKRALGLINDGQTDGYYHSRVEEGEVEFDEFGNLKKIGRTQPKMIDLNRYCANRYKVEKKGQATYIICVFGEAIVNAINATTELPPSVKAFRFKRKVVNSTITQEMIDQMSEEDKAKAEVGQGFSTVVWEYERSEFIQRDEVYKMTKKLENYSALELMRQVEAARVDSGDSNVDGDTLDAIA